jgi:hypothetical protein
MRWRPVGGSDEGVGLVMEEEVHIDGGKAGVTRCVV